MFLHIVALDRQLSVHADEKTPLWDAIDEAFEYHGKKRGAPHRALSAEGLTLDPRKTPKANGLEENDIVYVTTPAPIVTKKVAKKPTKKGRVK